VGLFDTVRVDERFTCSEGHDLTGEEWQSKDFGETDGDVIIAEDTVTLKPGEWGDSPMRPLLGRFAIYTTCKKCPAFVQRETGNMIGHWVEYVLEIVDDRIRAIKLVSDTAKEFAEKIRKLSWMKDAYGPMTYEEAEALHSKILDERCAKPVKE
jgi:hypothetical protein